MHNKSSSESLKDFNRLDINFRKSLIEEALPEYFLEDYPNLITFLEGYYENLDSDGSFGGIINELQTIRDIEDTELERLDLLFNELALGISNDQVKTPREAIRNFGNFFRVKGSLFSGEGFFRAFFDENVEIVYPKKDLFTIGNSTIGTEDGWVMQDGKAYQIFSILIKSPISIAFWEDLYRKFVHPSGFYLSGQVALEGIPEPIKITVDESVPDPFKDIKFITEIALAYTQPKAVGEATHLNNHWPGSLVPGSGHINLPQFRTHPNRLLGHFMDSDIAVSVGNRLYTSLADLNTVYRDLKELTDYGIHWSNAFDSNGHGLSFDNSYEKLDQARHETYAVYVPTGFVQSGYNVGLLRS
jgi:hypothetical protein